MIHSGYDVAVALLNPVLWACVIGLPCAVALIKDRRRHIERMAEIQARCLLAPEPERTQVVRRRRWLP